MYGCLIGCYWSCCHPCPIRTDNPNTKTRKITKCSTSKLSFLFKMEWFDRLFQVSSCKWKNVVSYSKCFLFFCQAPLVNFTRNSRHWSAIIIIIIIIIYFPSHTWCYCRFFDELSFTFTMSPIISSCLIPVLWLHGFFLFSFVLRRYISVRSIVVLSTLVVRYASMYNNSTYVSRCFSLR